MGHDQATEEALTRIDRSLLPVEVIDQWKQPSGRRRLLRGIGLVVGYSFLNHFVPWTFVVAAIVPVALYTASRWWRGPRRAPELADRGAFGELIDLRYAALSDASERMTALFDYGYAHMRAGNLDQAVSIFGEVCRRAPHYWSEVGVVRVARAALALCHACLGELEPARVFAKKAGRHLEPARILIAARAGEYRAASQLHVQRRNFLWGRRGHEGRVFYLLRAFASAQAGGEPTPDDLERARPICSVEFGYLTNGWPELAAFAARLEPKGSAAVPTARLVGASMQLES